MQRQTIAKVMEHLVPTELDDKQKSIQFTLAGIAGLVGAYFEALFIPVILLAAFSVLDYITGMLRAWRRRELDSTIGKAGIVKKLGLFIMVGVGIGLDWVVVISTQYVGYDLPFKNVFSWILSFWLVLNEMISILENLQQLGVKVPGFLVSRLKRTQETIEKKADSDEDKEE